jgi:hypothetical protein
VTSVHFDVKTQHHTSASTAGSRNFARGQMRIRNWLQLSGWNVIDKTFSLRQNTRENIDETKQLLNWSIVKA